MQGTSMGIHGPPNYMEKLRERNDGCMRDTHKESRRHARVHAHEKRVMVWGMHEQRLLSDGEPMCGKTCMSLREYCLQDWSEKPETQPEMRGP
jgi:hypothetical protein